MQGIAKGFRILSELNLGVTFLFMLLVLLVRSDDINFNFCDLQKILVPSLSGLIRVGFKAYAYDVEHLDWFYGLDGFLLGMVVFMGAWVWNFLSHGFLVDELYGSLFSAY